MESTGALAHGVIELTQTLARCTRQIKERGYEKERLSSVQAEFRKHLAWQQQRMHSLQRDVERLHNEKSWLTEKTSEVDQDASLLAHEIRQCRRETEQFRRERDTLQSELDTVDAEVTLEEECCAALQTVIAQGHKALVLHSRQRDAYKVDAEMAKLEAFRLKDRIEELAYRLNGLATNK